MKDSKFAPQSRATTIATPVTKRPDTIKYGSKGYLPSPRQNSKGTIIQEIKNSNQVGPAQQTSAISRRRNTPSYERKRHQQVQDGQNQTDEESYQLSRSESRPRRVKTSHGKANFVAHSSAQKASQRSGQGGSNARQTHTGFFSRQNKSRDPIRKHSGDRMHSKENQSVDYQDQKTVDRGFNGDNRGGGHEKSKLPFIRILDKKKNSHHKLPRMIDIGYGDRSKIRLDDNDSGGEDITQRYAEEPEDRLFKSKSMLSIT